MYQILNAFTKQKNNYCLLNNYIYETFTFLNNNKLILIVNWTKKYNIAELLMV